MALHRVVLTAALALAGGALAASPAAATPAAGIAGGHVLAVFDTARPDVVSFTRITGLTANERVIGLDVRPFDGRLYGVTATQSNATDEDLRVVQVDPATAAVARPGGATVAVTHAVAAAYDIDFNPTVDRIRVIDSNGLNFRVNPTTGGLAGVDTALSPGSPVILGVGYDRSVATATQTTAYAVRADTDQLGTLGGVNSVPSANGGVFTGVGALGFDAASRGSFDVSTDGVGYLVDGSRLSSVNLATGAATSLGSLAAPLDAIAVGAPVTPPTPPAPQTVTNTVTVTVPGPPAEAKDLVAPGGVLVLPANASARALRRGVTVPVACGEACSAAVTVTFGKATVASATAKLAAGATANVKVKLTAKGATALSAALRRRPSASLTVALRVTDAAGNARTQTQRLKVTR